MPILDVVTAVPVRPAVQPAGTPGWATAGDPQSNTAATIIGADWFNDLQGKEAALLAAGLSTLQKGPSGDADWLNAIRVVALSWVIEEFVPGPPGRIKFRAGPMLQWGIAAIASGAGDFVVLPVTFTNKLLHVISSDAGANGWRTGWSRDGASKISFRAWGFNQANNASAMNYGYLVIGH